jgi:uncharacterized protein
MMNEVFHNGERAIQNKVGETLNADRSGTVITDEIMAGAINFIEKQPMAIVSSVDKHGQVWASLLIGDFGFVCVPNPNALLFNTNMIRSTKSDIFYKNIEKTPEMGSLFIELATRRRFKINGISTIHAGKIDVQIQEAYPNCPKYIQKRVISLPDNFMETKPTIFYGEKLGALEKDWMSKADTLFVGSQSNEGRLDVNHRGGNAGFVEILDDITLKIPDYRGNSMFNTFGNIFQNPNVGLLFIDFKNGHTLQLTGKAELLFEQKSEKDLQKTGGTGRFWLFKIEHWVRTENHHKVDWEFMDYSPFNP